MEQKPLVIINGQIQQLPNGDTIAGVIGSTLQREPLSVFNNGSPEVVFDKDGDVVTNYAA